MRTVAPMLLVVACLAACGAGGPRSAPLLEAGTSKRSLDAATACVIATLNREFASQFTHHSQIVRPGAVHEVVTQQPINMWADDNFYVRLTAAGKATRIEIFSPPSPAWTTRLRPALSVCA